VFGLLAIIGAITLFNLFGTNGSTEYLIKQAAVTGNLSCITEPGVYGKMFGSVSQYDRTGTFYFSNEKLDGGIAESFH
jgi:hypothetical protein